MERNPRPRGAIRDALGDSYSSGEGDVEQKADGGSYYINGTDRPDGCHLSARSYPFILRDKWSISQGKMRSVACSGAQVLPDYYYPVDSYTGQENTTTSTQDKGDALENFIPGVVPQLEFVKKYKPKVVTLTGGGNDVGFADILKYCAHPAKLGTYTAQGFTCEYAIAGNPLNDLLQDAIKSQGGYTARLLQQIKEVSPHTKIVVVGYPSFINSTSVCALNSASLSVAERTFINESLRMLNLTLKNAAIDAGATFVDIEDSLKGGRLCEGSEYVTGLWFERYFNNNEQKNSFHPNAAGHTKIANEIHTTIPSAENITPLDGIVTPGVPEAATFLSKFFEALVVIGNSLQISGKDFQFKPNSEIEVTGYSDPVNLGNLTASDIGKVLGELDISGLEPGLHTIVFRGKSYSGEPVVYYQFLTVAHSEDDIDGDGIKNKNDRCDFITSWYDEATGKDVCEVEQGSSIPDAPKRTPASQSTEPPVASAGSPDTNVDLYDPIELAANNLEIPSDVGEDKASSTTHTTSITEAHNSSLQVVAGVAITLILAYSIGRYIYVKTKQTH